jgi:hypothetical protein
MRLSSPFPPDSTLTMYISWVIPLGALAPEGMTKPVITKHFVNVARSKSRASDKYLVIAARVTSRNHQIFI